MAAAVAVLLTGSITIGPSFKRAPARASCQNNEKQFGLVFKMYEGEHDYWPELAPRFGVLQPDWSALYDDYLSDMGVAVCPSDERVNKAAVLAGLGRGSYYYLGYIVRDEAEMAAFAAAYRARIAEGGRFDVDLPVPSEHGGGFIRRLSAEAIAEFTQEGDGRDIPVLFERPEHHVPGGMNVLYADGHVEFVRFGTRFPSVQAMVDFLDMWER